MKNNPAAPKRVPNEYFLFNKMFGPKILEGKEFGSLGERAQEVKKAFDKMTAAQKKELDTERARLLKLYDENHAKFVKDGYYMTEDGKRSDLIPVKIEGGPALPMDLKAAHKQLKIEEM